MARKQREKVVTEAIDLDADHLIELSEGKFRIVLNKLLRQIYADISDRGEQDGKARHLVIDFEFIKVNGMLVVTPRPNIKLPTYVCDTTATIEKIDADGEVRVLFQPWNAANAYQPTFSDAGTPPNNEP